MIIATVALITLVSVLLIIIVLAQDPKSGAFTAGGSANQFMGVQKTTDLLERLTWGFGIALFVLSISTSFMIERPEEVEQPQATEAPAANGGQQQAPAQGGGQQ